MERTKASRHAVVDSQGTVVLSSRCPSFLLSCRTDHAAGNLPVRLALGSGVSSALVGYACDLGACLRALLQLLQPHLQRQHRVVVGVGCL